MRICFPFVGDSIGGSQISAALLIKALDDTGYQPVVVVHQAGPLSDFLKSRDISFALLPLTTYVGSGSSLIDHGVAIVGTLPRLRRFLKEHSIDVVHTQDGRMNQTWSLAARLSQSRQVWHQRSVYAPSRLTRFTMSLADAVICNSRFVLESLPAALRGRAQAIVNPFEISAEFPDRSLCRSRCLAEIGAPSLTRIVGFVGNLSQQKRPLKFIEAAARIHRETTAEVAFVMFGQDRENLYHVVDKQIEILGLTGLVRLMGFRDPIEDWIAACDVLLAPEVNDAFGRTLVEAMLVGTAVVAADSGGHGEIVDSGRTGILVEADDANALASAALGLLNDNRRRKRMTSEARREARANYSVLGHTSAVTSVYDSLMAL